MPKVFARFVPLLPLPNRPFPVLSKFLLKVAVRGWCLICLGLNQDFFLYLSEAWRSGFCVCWWGDAESACLASLWQGCCGWLLTEFVSCQSWRGFTRDTFLLKWLVLPTSQYSLLLSLILDCLWVLEELISLITVHLAMISVWCLPGGGIYHSSVLQRVNVTFYGWKLTQLITGIWFFLYFISSVIDILNR